MLKIQNYTLIFFETSITDRFKKNYDDSTIIANIFFSFFYTCEMKIESIKSYNQYISYKPLKDKKISHNQSFKGKDFCVPVSYSNLVGISFRQNLNVGNIAQIGNSNNKPTVKDLYNKFQKQLEPVTTEEVEKIVKKIEREGIKREDALYSLQSLTQFGNIQSLVKLGEKFSKSAIGNFCQTENLSCNSAFYYLYKKKCIEYLPHYKEAYILDNAGLDYLEKNPDEANYIIKNLRGNTVFVNLEGWNDGLNLYCQGKDDDYIVNNAVRLINRAYEIKADGDFESAFDKAVNEKVLERAEKLGIKNVQTISLKDNPPTIQSIAENLLPINISEKFIDEAFNIISEELYPEDKGKQAKAKQLITEYFNYESEIFSPKRLGKCLKTIHNEILDFAKKHKKSDGSAFEEDDIVYIIPERSRSYDQIALQYAKVNDVPLSKFRKNIIDEDNKIYVVLDDLISSGNNMLSKDFNYERVNLTFKNYHVIMASVTANQAGIDNINREIKKHGRENQDAVIVTPGLIKTRFYESEFYKKLPLESKEMLHDILKATGNDHDSYNKDDSAFLFPYMGPDNNATITSYIFQKLVPSIDTLKNKYERFGALRLANRILGIED